ncbi:L-aspartate oxidase [Planctomycetota bacterium]
MNIKMPLNKRALLDVNPDTFPAEECDVLVVGSGGAGMMAALHAARKGKVILATKKGLENSNTSKAQGGIAAAISPEDTVDSHIEDTLKSGKGLCDPEVVEQVIGGGAEAVEELIKCGAAFDGRRGKLIFTKEGGHSRARIIRANGDATGAEISRALIKAVKRAKGLNVCENCFLIDLLKAGERVVGALMYRTDEQQIIRVLSKAVILASGGMGKVYRETTNPRTATGDGLAAALRAGVALQDMEFLQFHPTTLYIAGSARLLISETLRGEGGILVDRNGARFMGEYSDQMELASRDIVAKAIHQHIKKYGGTNVFLDMTHLDGSFLKKRFPWIYSECLNFKIDITKRSIPVHPAMHYTIGGIKAAVDGQTTLKGLFICGEAASTRFHGANRLGSNSLLETAVCGKMAGEAAAAYARCKKFYRRAVDIRKDDVMQHQGPIDIADSIISMQSEMWRHVGIERSFEGLNSVWGNINFWSGYILGRTFDGPQGWELQNMLQVSQAIIKSAITRTESRGAHFREDYPDMDDERWNTHIVLEGE